MAANEVPVGGLAQPLVEVDHHGRGNPFRSETLQALMWVAQERRRLARDHLVGVVVERDHDRAGGPPAGLGNKMLQQVRVPAVETVEHPDDHEHG